jgi:hypothetical protein
LLFDGKMQSQFDARTVRALGVVTPAALWQIFWYPQRPAGDETNTIAAAGWHDRFRIAVGFVRRG